MYMYLCFMVNNIHISHVPHTKDFTTRLSSLQLPLRVPGMISYTLTLWLQKFTAQHAVCPFKSLTLRMESVDEFFVHFKGVA